MLYPYDSSALIITGPAVISQLFLPSEQIYLRMKFRSCAFSHILLSVYCSTFSSQLIPVVLAKQIIKWNTLYGWNLDSSGNIWPIYLTLFILIIKNLDEIRLKLVRFKCGNGSLFFSEAGVKLSSHSFRGLRKHSSCHSWLPSFTGKVSESIYVRFACTKTPPSSHPVVHLSYRVYCLLGDGEMSEGAVWEAMSFASYYQLDNLVAIMDINRLGQSDPAPLQHHVEKYQKRCEAFG